MLDPISRLSAPSSDTLVSPKNALEARGDPSETGGDHWDVYGSSWRPFAGAASDGLSSDRKNGGGLPVELSEPAIVFGAKLDRGHVL